jgi:hypothetical protein
MPWPAAGQHPLVQVHEGVQRVHGQAHPGQVHPVDDRADDGRLVSFPVHAALGGVQPGAVPEEPQVLGCLLAVDPGAAGCFAVGAQAAQRGDVAGVAVDAGGEHRVPRGDRDTPEGRAGREFRAAAGDSLRAGRGCGRGGFPCLLAGLAGLLLRLGAGRPVPPGGLAGLLLRFPRLGPGLAGRIAALFLQLRRGEDLARGGQPGCPPAQQVISQVMVDAGRAGHPPHRLLRRGDIDPGSPAQRAAQRLEHPLRAARRPFPDSGERVTPGQPRRYRDRDHARQGEPHAPRVPPVRQPRQPVPQRYGHGGTG